MKKTKVGKCIRFHRSHLHHERVYFVKNVQEYLGDDSVVISILARELKKLLSLVPPYNERNLFIV